ncbi:hypothetical protein FNU76_06295 [Chitinimonas arctica]|uniref:Uncharacterized protein n=1 Tax=Chitinimonas arctica TaxID=2594795 RepID=A0A516SCW2_9NEIS|nr:hypothetical protein [Chitinimonas arctica]QDQ25992.1 hypothetical protein FNU76_06295 [Chitinimonas arctica]
MPRLATAANALLAPATPSAPQRYAVALEYRITPAHGHSGVILDPDGPVSAVLAIDAVQGSHVDWEALAAKLATRAQQAEKEGRTEAAQAEREASRLCMELQARYGATTSKRKATLDRPSRRR